MSHITHQALSEGRTKIWGMKGCHYFVDKLETHIIVISDLHVASCETFNGIVHSKLKFHPFTTQAYCGHRLKTLKKKGGKKRKKQNLSP